MEANGPNSDNPGGIITWLRNKNEPPILLLVRERKVLGLDAIAGICLFAFLKTIRMWIWMRMERIANRLLKVMFSMPKSLRKMPTFQLKARGALVLTPSMDWVKTMQCLA